MPDSIHPETPIYLVDGSPAATITLSDRGLHYGDGLFETLAVDQGRPLAFEQHLARLQRGCRMLALNKLDMSSLRTECVQVAATAEKAVLKIIITRGSGGRGYKPAPSAKSRRVVSLHPWPSEQQADRLGKVFICRQRLHENPSLAGIKHLNRLEQVLASAEWPDETYFEGLMQDVHNNFVAGTKSNLFVIKDNQVQTAPLDQLGIAGIVREAVLQHAKTCGLRAELCPIDTGALRAADEIFVTNSIMGVRSVSHIDGINIRTSTMSEKTVALTDALKRAGVIV